jgi:hypothetical protein
VINLVLRVERVVTRWVIHHFRICFFLNQYGLGFSSVSWSLRLMGADPYGIDLVLTLERVMTRRENGDLMLWSSAGTCSRR